MDMQERKSVRAGNVYMCNIYIYIYIYIYVLYNE
jgi:hypothetical protein